ncbi:hypothetical protein SCMU_37380 [Sinomonas cyclohexanicum]|uniref:DUF1854 domain-containing protein n=1 Tax=Sinomonas cyclohexanicum TaxID=322009 RepID=A0ABM7Q006_SINCY|nr:hypothetical protein [Corynebacterium cyclohexanicum]BCT77896.1 hypothetical protein SCMU_37380 [Corynebacterium cyclohexanicum]
MSAAPGATPLIVIDEAGEFRLYPNEAELLSSDERPETTRCVIDAQGHYLHLEGDAEGHPALSRSLGTVEFHVVRQQFLRLQHRRPEDHRLLRRCPATLQEVLGMLFEELDVEAPADHREWIVSTGEERWVCHGLAAVDERVARTDRPVLVTDPFGHVYRPHVMAHGSLARRLRGRPLYVEVQPQGAADPQAEPSRPAHVSGSPNGATVRA